jgi:hypothetical protein
MEYGAVERVETMARCSRLAGTAKDEGVVSGPIFYWKAMLRLRRKFGWKEEVRPEFTSSLSVLTVEILKGAWLFQCNSY